MNHEVLADSQQNTSSQRKPGVGWVILGFFVGWLGFLALTGAACAEGLLAGIAGAIAGGIWQALSTRKKINRSVTFVGGILLIALCAIAFGVMGRLRAPEIIFEKAFDREPPPAVQFENSRRFGYMDNTSFVAIKIDKATLDELLAACSFKSFEDAAQWLQPPSDRSLRLADHERNFRRAASGVGMFSEELPFHSELSVFERRINRPSGGPSRMITVTWDPKTTMAYVFVADF